MTVGYNMKALRIQIRDQNRNHNQEQNKRKFQMESSNDEVLLIHVYKIHHDKPIYRLL